MVYIKANNEIIKVYQRIIMSMKERVEWYGDIIIRKNTMILVGRVRSMYFELATRRVYSDIEELTFDSAKAFEMGNNKLMINIVNMLLYPFGKWGAIKGLNVEQDYRVLGALFSQIFKEIDVETYFTKTSLRFFINGIQITFEDAMEKCIKYIEKQHEIKLAEQDIKGKKGDNSKKIPEESAEKKKDLAEKVSGGKQQTAAAEKNGEVKSEKATDSKTVRKKTVYNGIKLQSAKADSAMYKNKADEDDNKAAEGSAEPDVEYGDEKIQDNEEKQTGAGLWHNMRWRVGHFDFKREDVDKKYANSHRMGNNFYVVPYECPDCGDHLHMVVYPQGRENVIDTDDGRIYITRAYTCDNCKKFYTARPGKLLREGDAYVLDFDNDEYAARDYVKLLGKKGAKTGNSNFNMYESDYGKQVASVGKKLSERCRKMELLTDEELEQILAQIDDGFFSDYERERFLAIIEQELEYREKMRNKKFGEFGRRSDERTEDELVEEEQNIDDSDSSQENDISEDAGDESELDDTQTDEADMQNADEADISKEDISEKNASETDAKEEAENYAQQDKTAEDKKDTKRRSIFGNIKVRSEKNRQSDKEQGERKVSFVNPLKKADKGSKTVASEISVRDIEDKSTGDNDNIKPEFSENLEKADSVDDDIKKVDKTDIKENFVADKGSEKKEKPVVEKNIDVSENDIVEDTVENDKRENVKTREDNSKNEKKDSVPADTHISFFDRITDESRTAKYSDIVENIKKVKASKGDEQEKNHYIDVLTKLCKEAAKREIEFLLSHLPGNINFDRYKRTKEKLMTYTEIDVKPYIKIVDAKRDKVEFDELNKLVESVDRDNRDELLEMMEKIKNGEYEKRNSDRFVEGLRKRVYAMDEAKLRGICPNPDEMTFDEGLQALKEIEKGVFLPELKSNMLQLIDKKLTTLKTEECELLVRKLERDLDGKLADMSRIHFYDIRKMRDGDTADKETSFAKVAISTYAYATGQYEYPIVICDSSMFNSGKEGFIITPDHIFYKGLIKSGSIDVKDINTISSEKKGLMVEHSEKGNTKLPCTINKKDEKNMAEVLDRFIAYLKMKPESRSVEYMSKSEHKIKCCYRCGHVFSEGSICPKCGSRFEG